MHVNPEHSGRNCHLLGIIEDNPVVKIIKSVAFLKEIATFNDGILFESSLDAISIVEAVKRQSIPGSITQVR